MTRLVAHDEDKMGFGDVDNEQHMCEADLGEPDSVAISSVVIRPCHGLIGCDTQHLPFVVKSDTQGVLLVTDMLRRPSGEGLPVGYTCQC